MDESIEIVSVGVLMKVAQHVTVMWEGGQLYVKGMVWKTHNLLWKVGPACIYKWLPWYLINRETSVQVISGPHFLTRVVTL